MILVFPEREVDIFTIFFSPRYALLHTDCHGNLCTGLVSVGFLL